NREPKAQSAELCTAALFEGIKNFRQCFRLNSQAAVCNLNVQVALSVVARRENNPPVIWRKFHRIVYQVPKDLLKSRRVCSQLDLTCAEIYGMQQMLAVDFRLTNLESILKKDVSVDDIKIQLHLTPFNPG